ncbi:MAG: penicillin-binding protein 2 [Kangiellaceae bacterium]|nr:penicillin-binding protein 2 [Kangiellaceae bacterium]
MLKSGGKLSNKHSFKDHYNERQLLIRRSIIAFAFVVIMLLALVARSWYLQIVRFEDYQTRSNDNRISVEPIAPKRGLIYDRNGVLLAENSSVYSLEIVPEKVKDIELTLDQLIELSLIDQKYKEKFLNDLRGQRRFKSISIKTRLTEKEVARFSVDAHRFPGVSVEARLVRYYPFGEDFVHALGYVGRINDRELARIDQANYKATRHIGKVGLEKFYEDKLHGTIGFRQIEKDVQGRVIGKPLFEKPPVPGSNIRLSLDVNLQKKASEAMAGHRGSIVAIDPRNGDVLALVSAPGYEPNDFVTGISSAKYKVLLESEDQPLFNRALRGLYSPGSTIKPHLGWIGLEKGLITPQFTIEDPGYWILPTEEKRVIRDWKVGGHGKKVNLDLAIAQSCDPYFYELAYRMGIDTISSNMVNFGFGQYTGIDMGEELAGNMPSREWKRKERKLPWFPGDTVNIGIGQGFWVATPLQLANAIAQLGIGGNRYRLRLMTSVQTSDDWQIFESEVAEKQASFSNDKNLQAVRESMRRVNRYGGSAFEAFKTADYSSAGKTGTVQVSSQDEDYDAEKVARRFRDNAVYVGFAPYENPEFALAVILENVKGGGSTEAAPVARKVFDEFYRLKRLRAMQQQKAAP